MARACPSGFGRRIALPLIAALALPTGAMAAPDLCPAGVAAPARQPLAALRARFGRPGDRYMAIDGVELRYRDEGRGPALLLLHGSRSTLEQWDGVAARLGSHYRIVRFDQPPAGLSGPLTAAAIAAVGSPEALVARFLDRLGIAQATLAGVSSGGTMAYYFAAAYPGRVRALILANTPSDPVPGLKIAAPPALDAATSAAQANGVEARAFWEEYLRFLYGDPARMARGLVDRYCATNLRPREPYPFGLNALTADAARTAARLGAVRAPVLVLWGMRDPVLRPEEGAALMRYLANARSRSFVALDTVGHYPPMESPEAVAALIGAWLERDR